MLRIGRFNVHDKYQATSRLLKHRTMQRRLVKQEGKSDNREPWWRANGPAPTARQIAIAFLKYDVAPWMHSSAFPPCTKINNRTPLHPLPARILLRPCLYFLGVHVDGQIYFSCLLFFAVTASGEIFYLFKLTADFFDCRQLATISLSELSSRSDVRINLFLIKYKQQIVENVI